MPEFNDTDNYAEEIVVEAGPVKRTERLLTIRTTDCNRSIHHYNYAIETI